MFTVPPSRLPLLYLTFASLLSTGATPTAADTKPADTRPVDTQPADTRPATPKPAATKSTDTKPSDTKPSDTKPSDTKPSDAKPSDTKFSNTKGSGTKAPGTKPSETRPAETRPAASKPSDTRPAVKTAEQADPDVGSVRRVTMQGFTYFYKSTKTNMQFIGEEVRTTIPELNKAMAQGKVQAAGPMIFIYHGASPDPHAPFVLEIGLPVADGSKPAGNFKVRKVPEFPCASVIYSGPLKAKGAAFDKLALNLKHGPDAPTDESREMYLYLEGPDSSNNVVQVCIGLK